MFRSFCDRDWVDSNGKRICSASIYQCMHRNSTHNYHSTANRLAYSNGMVWNVQFSCFHFIRLSFNLFYHINQVCLFPLVQTKNETTSIVIYKIAGQLLEIAHTTSFGFSNHATHTHIHKHSYKTLIQNTRTKIKWYFLQYFTIK